MHGHMNVKLASSCLSAWNSAPNGRILIKFGILCIFRKPAKKIQVSLQCDKNNGDLTLVPTYIYDISADSSYNKKLFTQNLWRESKHIFNVQ
jgi:hypothetical protein